MTSTQLPRGRALPSPGLVWQPGPTPFATLFGDVYFSREGGLAETEHVFLNGCGLPDAWQGLDAFTIGELGFGTGLNFLATWDLWRRTRPPGARLHYVAVEGCPLTRAELAQCLETWPALRPLAEGLLRVYPEPQPGFHRLFPCGTHGAPSDVHLTLLYGEVGHVLGQLEADVNAWFLDGFSPDKNPQMWRDDVFRQLARLSHKDTRVATFSAASVVRRGLDSAGFEMAKAPGFGHKREMLQGRFRGGNAKAPPALQPWFARPAPAKPGHAAIIGGGIAGTSAAQALQRRGWRTTIVDRRSDLAEEASGNPAGIVMPRLTAAPNLDGRFYAAAWRFVLESLERILPERDRGGLLQLATDESEAGRQAAIVAARPLPDAMLTQVDAGQASEIADCKVPFGALYFPQGGWIQPRAFCAALARESQLLLGVDVGGLRRAHGQWQVLSPSGDVHLQADVVVLANALGAAALPITTWMPLKARRGQISLAPPTTASSPLRSVLAFGGYMTPAHKGVHSIGATFDWVDVEDMEKAPVVNDADHARNLEELARVLPDLMTGIDLRAVSGRAGLRCTTLDHLALAGPVPDHGAYLRDFAELRHGHPWARYADAAYQPGLYTLTGLGARGLVAAPLAAEIIASHIAGEPWPVERDLGTALHPGRFLVRDLKRRDA